MSTVRMYNKQHRSNKLKFDYLKKKCVEKSLPIQESWAGEINEASMRFSKYIDEMINQVEDDDKRRLLKDRDGNHNVRIKLKDERLGMVEGNISLQPNVLQKDIKPSCAANPMSPIMSSVAACSYPNSSSHLYITDLGSPSNQTTAINSSSINASNSNSNNIINNSVCELAGDDGIIEGTVIPPTFDTFAFSRATDTSLAMQQIRQAMCLTAGSNDSTQIAACLFGIFNRRRTSKRIMRYKRHFDDSSRIDPEKPYNEPYEQLLQTINNAIKKKQAQQQQQQSLRKAPR